MKRADPIRNMAKWEKRPLGGLVQTLVSSVKYGEIGSYVPNIADLIIESRR